MLTDRARNKLCEMFLKKDYDYMCQIDDDNPVNADFIQKFIEDDKDVIIGTIPSRLPDHT